MITILVARDGAVTEASPAELESVLRDRRAHVWIDLENTGEAGFEALRPTLEFHPLAVQDCVSDINYPKVDDYGDYLYIAVHSARWDEDQPQPAIRELDILIGRRFLLTYHEEPTRSIQRAREILARRGALLERGPDQLLHFLLDVMVDNYLPILERLEVEIDGLEERVFGRPTQRLVIDVLRLKHGLASLRRIVGPQRDTILSLTREEFSGIRRDLRPYLRDVFDRMARVGDVLETFRDELSTLLEIYSTQVSNRLNEVMKVLTVITVILMPATLVASIYGMNVAYPEQGWPAPWGYLWALGVIVAVGLAMYWFIRSRRWL
jgi:magnesium transporter